MSLSCVLSHINVGTTTEGFFQVCCHGINTHKRVRHGGHELTVSDTIEHLDDVLHADSAAAIRAALDGGEWPEHCSRCKAAEAAGVYSPRIAANERFAHLLDGARAGATPRVAFLELRWSNLCNLRCVTCNPERSSAIAKERMEEGRYTPPPMHVPGERFYQQVVDTLPALEMLKFSGGEPLLIKNTERLLREAIAVGRAEHIELEFNTNVTIFPAWLEELLPRFQKVTFELSIDGTDDHFEYIRNPGHWPTAAKNLDRYLALAKASPTIHLLIAPTICIFNILHLPTLLRWAEATGVELKGNILYGPQDMNLRSLPTTMKPEIAERVLREAAALGPAATEIVQDAVTYMMQPAAPGVPVDATAKAIQRADRRKRKSLEQVDPDLVDLFRRHLPSVSAGFGQSSTSGT